MSAGSVNLRKPLNGGGFKTPSDNEKLAEALGVQRTKEGNGRSLFHPN